MATRRKTGRKLDHPRQRAGPANAKATQETSSARTPEDSNHLDLPRPRIRTWVLWLIMAVLFCSLAVTSLNGKSVTVDEFGHLPVGYNLLTTGDFAYCEYNPPLMNVLSALPLLAMDVQAADAGRPEADELKYAFWGNGYRFMEANAADYHRIFVAARCVTVAAAVLLGLLVFLWARVLAPRNADAAGLLAAGLIWFTPNTLAHSRLVTTDIGALLFMTLALFAFYLFLRRRSWWRVIAAGVALGVAQLVKFTAVYLYPILVIEAIVWAWRRKDLRRRALAGRVAVILLLSLIVLNAGYFFGGSGRTLGQYSFDSQAPSGVKSVLPGWTPTPLPAAYVLAFDRQMVVAQQEEEPAFLFGEIYTGGRWYYYLALLLIKTPIATLLLTAIAVVTLFTGRRRRERPSRPAYHLFLLLPAGVILVVFSCAGGLQVGMRLVLPAAAWTWVWVAITLADDVATYGRWFAGAIAVLLVWLGVETLRIHPDYLAYFNQFIGGPSQGYRYALDSNLDWGQDLPKLKAFMDKHDLDTIQLVYFGRVDPEIYGIDYTIPLREPPRPGFLAVSATLYGRSYLINDHGNFYTADPLSHIPKLLGEPEVQLGYSIHVYRIGMQPRSDQR